MTHFLYNPILFFHFETFSEGVCLYASSDAKGVHSTKKVRNPMEAGSGVPETGFCLPSIPQNPELPAGTSEGPHPIFTQGWE